MSVAKKRARAPLRRQTREHVAHHEAGHFVAAYFLGTAAGVVSVSIAPSGRWAGENAGDGAHPLDDDRSVRESLRYVVHLYAGHAAEVRCDPSRSDAARITAADDDEKADDELRSRRWTKDERARREEDQRAEAAALIEEHWPCVSALAAELLERTTLDGHEAAWIVAVAEGERAARELARYRVRTHALRKGRK